MLSWASSSARLGAGQVVASPWGDSEVTSASAPGRGARRTVLSASSPIPASHHSRAPIPILNQQTVFTSRCGGWGTERAVAPQALGELPSRGGGQAALPLSHDRVEGPQPPPHQASRAFAPSARSKVSHPGRGGDTEEKLAFKMSLWSQESLTALSPLPREGGDTG